MSGASEKAETIATLFHRAVCSRCNVTADLDGGEFAPTPEKAVEAVLSDAEWVRIDGRLVCDSCLIDFPEFSSGAAARPAERDD